MICRLAESLGKARCPHGLRFFAPLLPLLVLLLLDSARYGEATCATVVEPRDVNESSTAGLSIRELDSSYSLTMNADPVYSCYFEISNGSLRLTKPFDLENFTSCADGSTVPMVSVLSAVPIAIPCSSPSSAVATTLVRLVDINEFPPVFVPNTFRLNVSEVTAVSTQIIQMSNFVVDRDRINQRTFNLAILSGSFGDFAMNDGVTSGIVRISRALDYDLGTRQYVMNISASDLPSESSSLPVPLTGYATLTIDIVDVDDLNPYFTQPSYTLQFMENDTAFANRPLATAPPLDARDGDIGINQTVNYAIHSVMWSGSTGSLLGNVTFLSINATTGQLTVLDIVDRETLPTNQLLVQVKAYQTDKPDTRVAMALVLVTVGDKNDNVPVMSAALYNISVAENSLLGTYVTAVGATDADVGVNATFTFQLNDTTGAFQVDPNSGQVTVANPALLDRETTQSFVMTVWARESLTPERFASPASVLVVNLIDLNDNSPVFSPPNATYAFSVSGGAAVGSVVGTVVATDADLGANGLVRFSIVWAEGTSGGLFQLDPVTGTLTTLASLSGLPAGSFVLQVVAEDQAAPLATRRQSRAIVRITLVTTQTTPAGQINTSSVSLVTYTTAAASGAGTSVSGDTQIALIVICALLLLAVIILLALSIWCWQSRQRQALNVSVLAPGPPLGNGLSAAGSTEADEVQAGGGGGGGVSGASAKAAESGAYTLQPLSSSSDGASFPRLIRLSGLQVVDLPDVTI